MTQDRLRNIFEIKRRLFDTSYGVSLTAPLACAGNYIYYIYIYHIYSTQIWRAGKYTV